ncbi:uncharacterized protein LOC119172874 [Rhipicephalus microplus]|uniref:uncharacterized protein LOC119172874 n=1 Tax=Rhipicephalus microplus TaxID=6941 RepID=UPI003F6AED39
METLHIFTFLLFCVGAIVFVSAAIYFLQGLEEPDDDNDTMSGKNSSGMKNVPDQRGTGGGGDGWNELSLPSLLPRTAQTREVVTSTASGGPDLVHVQTTLTTTIVPPMQTTPKPPTTKPTTPMPTTPKPYYADNYLINAYDAEGHHSAAYHAEAYNAETYDAEAYHAEAYHAKVYHAEAYHAETYNGEVYHAKAEAYYAEAYHTETYHTETCHDD